MFLILKYLLMKPIIILIILFLVIITSCKNTKNNTIVSDKDTNVIIELKNITICKSENKDIKYPTFLFYLSFINKTEIPYVLFAKNNEDKSPNGEFYLSFKNKNKEIILELADFNSKNPLIIEAKDSLKMMLTSINSTTIEFDWNEKRKKEFLENCILSYIPKTELIEKDSNLINNLQIKILPKRTLTINKKTLIFE